MIDLYTVSTICKKKCVHRFLIRNRATLMVCVGSIGIWNYVAFCQMCRIFTAKALQSGKRQGLRCFTRWHTAVQPSKCGTFGGRKAAHMLPCFQVPQQSGVHLGGTGGTRSPLIKSRPSPLKIASLQSASHVHRALPGADPGLT